jgi:hypothetical protein
MDKLHTNVQKLRFWMGTRLATRHLDYLTYLRRWVDAERKEALSDRAFAGAGAMGAAYVVGTLKEDIESVLNAM